MSTPPKLSHAIARAARERYAAGGISQRALARSLGVHKRTAWLLLHGRIYKQAGGPVIAPKARVFVDSTPKPAEAVLIERIAVLEAELAERDFRIEELTAPPPPFADRDVPKGQRAIIGTLLRRPGQIVSHDALLAAMGSDSLNSLKVNMVGVRRAFPEVEISYSWGVGYRAEWRAGASRCAAE